MKKERNTQRRILYTLLALTMVLSMVLLSACGEGSKGATNDPNIGLWKATTGEMSGMSMEVSDLFGKGFTIELNTGGKCKINVDGSKSNGTWTLNEGAFTVKGGGLNCEGRLENGKMTLENVLGMGLTLIFEKEGGFSGPMSGEAGASEVTPGSAVQFYVLESMSGGDMGDYSAEAYYDLLEAMGTDRDASLCYILMHPDGSVQMVSVGMLIEGTWKDGVFTLTSDGEKMTMEYTISGEKLTTVDEDGATFVYILSSDEPPALPTAPPWEDDDSLPEDSPEPDELPPSDTPDNNDEPSTEFPEHLEWWEGDWYGYWLVDSTGDYYDSLLDGKWDCYAVISADYDGTATVYLWDDEEELGTVEIQISIEGGGIMGGATSEGGELFGYSVEHADWVLYPDIEDYDNMIVIQEMFEDVDGDWFTYEIYLRPWGMLWDDVPEDDRPQDYDGWYIGGDYYRDNMLDALAGTTVGGEPVFIHPGAIYATHDVGSAGNSTTSGDLTTVDVDVFTIGYPSNAELDEDWLGDMTIKDKADRYEISYVLYYSRDSLDSARNDMKDYENGTSDYTEFTQVIGGMTDVFAIKYNSIMWNEAKFSVAFKNPIDDYYGILFEITAMDTDNKIDDILALSEVQAILKSIQFK